MSIFQPVNEKHQNARLSPPPKKRNYSTTLGDERTSLGNFNQTHTMCNFFDSIYSLTERIKLDLVGNHHGSVSEKKKIWRSKKLHVAIHKSQKKNTISIAPVTFSVFWL